MFLKVFTTIPIWTFLLGMTMSFTFGVWWCRYFIPVPTNSKEKVCGQTTINRHASSSHRRPQSLHEELRTRDVVFIGVMTSQKFLTTRAKGVYETWGRNVPAGKLMFFAGNTGESKPKTEYPVVYLSVPDNGYPPQRKSLAMLKYIYDHYIDHYQWFIRADDDVYMRTGKLVSFLRKLDSNEKLLLGQAGIGKAHEQGKLGLREGDNFCMGGPGVIMSRGVLNKVRPHLEYCSNNTATYHEDTEVGRCLRNFVGVMCPWAYQAKELFHQMYANQGEAYNGDLSTAAVANAITLHPIKDPAYMRRVHVHYVTQEVTAAEHKAWSLNHHLDNLRKASSRKTTTPKRFRENVDFFRQASGTWDTFNARQIFPANGEPMRWIHDSMRTALVGVVRKGKKLIQAKGALKKYHSVRLGDDVTGYMNTHAILGIQYIIRLPASKVIRKTKDTKPKSVISDNFFHFQQPFSSLKYEEIANDVKIKTVHFIVPLAGRLLNFRRFLASFENAFLRHDKNVKLLIVYFPKLEESSKHKEALRMYEKKYPKGVFHWININTETFQRGLALNVGSKHFGAKKLLSFVDVDLVFGTGFLSRCRENTKLNHQVYFPIVFSKFHPNITRTQVKTPKNDFIIHKDTGLWRYYGFGQVCVYSDDVTTIGGFNTTIRGWGLEDVDFFQKIIKHGKMDVLRSPDRGLVHVFHRHTPCSPDSTTRQLKMCHAAKAAYLGSSSSAFHYLLRKRYLDI